MERDIKVDIVNAMHAMLGAVTPNWRAVFLKRDASMLTLTFLLDHESMDDREEIEDVALEMEALRTDPTELKVAIVVSTSPLAVFADAGQMVFARKE